MEDRYFIDKLKGKNKELKSLATAHESLVRNGNNISEMKMNMPIYVQAELHTVLRLIFLPKVGIFVHAQAPLFPYNAGSLPFVVRIIYDILHLYRAF